MTTIEIILALLSPLIVLLIYLIRLLIDMTSRMATVETNVKLLLQWVACLNGEMSSEKEFKTFLKKLKRVNKENFEGK